MSGLTTLLLLRNGLMVLLPIWLVLRWRYLGVGIGTLAVWTLPLLTAEFTKRAYPEYSLGVIYTGWFLAGWLAGLLYCLGILAIQKLTQIMGKRIAH